MSVALRHYILPLIDHSIMNPLVPIGADDDVYDLPKVCAHEAALIRGSAINLQRFTHCKYFETEISHHSVSLKPKANPKVSES